MTAHLVRTEIMAKDVVQARRRRSVGARQTLPEKPRKYDRHLMPAEEVGVVQGNVRYCNAPGQVLVERLILFLIVVAIAGYRQSDRSRLGAPSGASRALLIVADPGRDVTAQSRFEITQIDAQLHRGGAAQQVDVSVAELLLKFFP